MFTIQIELRFNTVTNFLIKKRNRSNQAQRKQSLSIRTEQADLAPSKWSAWQHQSLFPFCFASPLFLRSFICLFSFYKFPLVLFFFIYLVLVFVIISRDRAVAI